MELYSTYLHLRLLSHFSHFSHFSRYFMSTHNNSLSTVKSVLTPASNVISRRSFYNMPSGLPMAGITNSQRPVCGPFRAAMNAGDALGRRYLQCDCPNPLSAKSALNADGISQRGCGVIVNGYSTKQVPVANCNTKYVYDSSDYIRFKKLSAQRMGHEKRNNSVRGSNASSGGTVLRSLQRLRG